MKKLILLCFIAVPATFQINTAADAEYVYGPITKTFSEIHLQKRVAPKIHSFVQDDGESLLNRTDSPYYTGDNDWLLEELAPVTPFTHTNDSDNLDGNSWRPEEIFEAEEITPTESIRQTSVHPTKRQATRTKDKKKRRYKRSRRNFDEGSDKALLCPYCQTFITRYNTSLAKHITHEHADFIQPKKDETLLKAYSRAKLLPPFENRNETTTSSSQSEGDEPYIDILGTSNDNNLEASSGTPTNYDDYIDIIN